MTTLSPVPGSLFPLAVVITLASPLSGQTDYYNTDAGRPVRIEDAHPVERYTFEAQLAPLRMERADDGAYHWEFEPELAYGLLPGTHLEVGLHLDVTDRGDAARDFGLEGIEVAVLHNLNVETRSLPAFAIAAEAIIPAGDFGADRIYPSLTGIATRTFRVGRVHVNGRYTLGPAPGEPLAGGDLSRWMGGIAVDRAFPLRSALLIADVFVEHPMREGAELRWTVEGGGRYQLDPFFALDIGVGRRMTGDDPAWFVTIGAARTFGIQSLIPIPGR